jgi:hypothetical protein
MIPEEKEEGKESFLQRMMDAAHRMIEKKEKSPTLSSNKTIPSDEFDDRGKVFGGELTKEGTNFVESACNFLGYPENQVEGMFRVSGSTSAIKYLKTLIETGSASSIFVPIEDVHNVTSLVKMFLRQLKEPILSKELAFNMISSKITVNDMENSRGIVLKSILGLMLIIDQNREITKMDLPNLALILGPNLFFGDQNEISDGPVSFGDTSESSELLLGLADQYKQNNLNPNQEKFYEIKDLDELFTSTDPDTNLTENLRNINFEEKLKGTESEEETFIDNSDEKLSIKVIKNLKKEIKQIRKELEREREERIKLGSLIIPQLRKTQTDLIEVFKAINLFKTKIETEKTNEESSDELEFSDSMVKPKEEFSFADPNNVQ